MATYEIEGPDGSRYQFEAPDEASQDEVLQNFHQHLKDQTNEQAASDVKASRDWWRQQGELYHPDIPDTTAPASASLAEKALGNLPQQSSLSEYPDPLASLDFLRNYARGVAGPYVGRGIANASAAANALTGGKVGQPFDKAYAYQNAWDKAMDEESPQLGTLPVPFVGDVPVTFGGATKLVGGLTGPAPLASKIMKGGGLLSKTVKGGALGAGYGGILGFGEGDDINERLENAQSGAGWGGLLGLGLTPAIEGSLAAGNVARNKLAPTMARLRANYVDPAVEAIQRLGKEERGAVNLPGAGGGAGGAPEMAGNEEVQASRGAEAAASQMIADTMLREGKVPEWYQQQMDEAERATLYGGGGEREGPHPGASFGPNRLMLPDVSLGLQKLIGSGIRVSPEAADRAALIQSARQTGVTPASGPLPPEVGLPTRPLMSPPTGEAMGQAEAILENTKRALRIYDPEAHGHAATADLTEQKMMADARARAKPNFDAAMTAGKGLDLGPTLDPVLTKAQASYTEEAPEVQKAIDNVVDRFRKANTITAFHNNKRFVDAQIETLRQSKGPGRTNRPQNTDEVIADHLSALRKDLLTAVRGVKQNDLGALYGKALDDFSDAMTMKKAYNLGQQAFDENSTVGIGHFDQFADDKAAQKAFRLGTYGSMERAFGEKRLAQDVLPIVLKKRVLQLMGHIIPREGLTPTGRISMKGGAPAEYSDRPERYGRMLQNEQRMQASGAKIFGNSATAERLADDEAYQTLSHVSDIIKEGATLPKDDLHQTFYGTVMAIVKRLPAMVSKAFGMRQDTAVSLVRQLYTTDKGQIRQVLANAQMRMGRNRYARFRQLITDANAQILRTGTMQGMTGNEEAAQ